MDFHENKCSRNCDKTTLLDLFVVNVFATFHILLFIGFGGSLAIPRLALLLLHIAELLCCRTCAEKERAYLIKHVNEQAQDEEIL
jgi:hypothetical protein